MGIHSKNSKKVIFSANRQPKVSPCANSKNTIKVNHQLTSHEVDVIKSWILYSLRDVMGNCQLRRDIIDMFHIEKGLEMENTERVVTFDGFRDNDDEIVEYCLGVMITSGRTFFTACNIVDPSTGESHYVTFLVDNYKQKLTVMDPAFSEKGRSIYSQFVASDTIIPLFKQNGYLVSHVNVSEPLQNYSEEVFCQTWSMFLVDQMICNKGEQIVVPRTQRDKYTLLLGFYRKIFPLIREKFLIEYAKNIRKFGIKCAKNINPVDIFYKMTPCDLF